MEWLKKIWGLLTNPSFNVLRVLSAVAVVVLILQSLLQISIIRTSLRTAWDQKRRKEAHVNDLNLPNRQSPPKKIAPPAMLRINKSKEIASTEALEIVSETVPEKRLDSATFSVNKSKKKSKKNGNIVIVDVTMRNSNARKIRFSNDEFVLKDEKSQACEARTYENAFRGSGKSVPQVVYLLPQKELRRTLMFFCSDPAGKEFTLTYQDTQKKLQPTEEAFVSESVEVNGIYENWITSMCEANCDNYVIGPYSLAKPLKPESLGKRVWARGKMVKVEAFQPIAGSEPGAGHGERYIAERLEVEEYREI